MNFFDFMTKFATEEKFVEYFIKLRYKGKPVCHHSPSYNHSGMETREPTGSGTIVFRSLSCNDLEKTKETVKPYLNRYNRL